MTSTLSYRDFFAKFYNFLPTYLKHRWFSKWDKFNRELCFDAMQYDTLYFLTDFSATYTCSGQDEATCAQPKNSLQLVFVVAYSDENGKQINESFHFWGEVNKQSPASNYVFYNTCVIKIFEIFQTRFPDRFLRGCGFSDGCPEQFKSRHSAFEMTFLCVECNLSEYVHTFAPTAQFKCACDSCGNDNKQWLRQEELSGNIRASSAWLAFVALKQMPSPQQRNRNSSLRFQISARHQYFVAYEVSLTSEMRADPNVVVIRPPNGDKDNDSIPGIRSIYQLRTFGDKRSIEFRQVACWCPRCIVSDYDNCLVESKWISVDLDAGTSKPKRINKCSVCKQPGHNKKSILCVGRSDVGSAVPIPAQDIATLDSTLSEEEDGEEDFINDI